MKGQLLTTRDASMTSWAFVSQNYRAGQEGLGGKQREDWGWARIDFVLPFIETALLSLGKPREEEKMKTHGEKPRERLPPLLLTIGGFVYPIKEKRCLENETASVRCPKK